MKSLNFPFDEKFKDANPLDIIGLSMDLTNSCKFENCSVYVLSVEEIPDTVNEKMTTIQFKICAIKESLFEDTNETKHYIHKNYRAKDFCCQNRSFSKIANE